MSIKTLDDIARAPRQFLPFFKTAARTTVAATPFSVFDIAGEPGAGTLAVGNTAAGIVPTDATAGYPPINAFGAGKTGYLACADYANTVSSRGALFETLFSAGAYAFNANTTLASQPSYSARCAIAGLWAASTVFAAGDEVVNGTDAYICTTGGTSAASGGPTGTGSGITDNTCVWDYVSAGIDYGGTEIWIEAVTAFTGNPSFNITYTNQAGTGSRSTGTLASGAALTLGRYLRLPLQAGDSGVQQINKVTATVATVGTFNVHVLRRLWQGRAKVNNDSESAGPDATGCPLVYADSALRMVITPDSTNSGLPEFGLQIINV